jgi:hypothetical protein
MNTGCINVWWVTISDLPISVSSLLLVHLACLLDGYWNSLQHKDLHAAHGELTSVCLKGVLIFIVLWNDIVMHVCIICILVSEAYIMNFDMLTPLCASLYQLRLIISSISIGWLISWCIPHIAVLSSRWPNLVPLFWNTLEMLNKRFHWLYLLVGFITLSFAAVSWKLESNSSYWIWHRCESSFLVNSNFSFESLACVDLPR